MKKMKFILLTTAFIFAGLFTQNVQAQISLGAGLSYGTEIEEIGLNLRATYGITEVIDANAQFTLWFIGEDGVNISTINVDGHYKFLEKEKFDVYALAGLNFYRAKVDTGFIGDITVSETGLNVGAGLELALSDALGFFGEVKYVISDADQLVLTAGVMYSF